MNTKIILLLFLVACAGKHGFANTSVPQIGAKWYYSSLFMTPDMGYYQMEYIKDTIISEKTCKKFEVLDIDSKRQISSKLNAYILYDGKRIFQYINSNYHLLYDFNVNVGDTIKTSYSFSDNQPVDTDLKLKVTAVKDTLINSLSLKCYSFDCINSNYNICFSGKAIENIGNISGYFFPINCSITDVRKPTEFRCYQNDGFIFKSKLYMNSECDSVFVYPPNAVDENMFKNHLSVALNAENNSLTVNCPDNDEHKFTVYDALGRMRMKGELQNEIPVSIKSLNSGIYFLIVRLDYKSIKLMFIKK